MSANEVIQEVVVAPDDPSVGSLSLGELRSPSQRCNSFTTTTSKRMSGMSLSFTSPPSDASCKSFIGASPSPRQASISLSFSSNTCPLDYSTDVDSLALLPISPVTPACEDESCHAQPDPCHRPLHVEAQEQDQETVNNISTLAVLNGKTNDLPSKCDKEGPSNSSQSEVATKKCSSTKISAQESLPVPLEVSTINRSSDCNKRNSNGQSALSISSSNCFLKGMMLLIEKGADINLVDAYGRTPLILACENTESNDHHECISYLLQHDAKANIQDSFGRSALHVSARKGCARCIEILLNHGARTDLTDSSGDSPLHIATAYGNADAMEALNPAKFECQFEEESSVESVHAEYPQNQQILSSFYGSPREYCPSVEDTWRHRNNLTNNQLNDSGYFSTKSNNAWTKSSYYIPQPHKIEEERESSLESISDSLTEENTLKEDEKPIELQWILALVFRFFMSQLKQLISVIMPARLQQEPTSMDDIVFVQPPDHVREAMERFKLSRQQTFKT